MFYNDNYSKIIGPLKHPRSFGTLRTAHAATLPSTHTRVRLR
jgi:hypothetical protein